MSENYRFELIKNYNYLLKDEVSFLAGGGIPFFTMTKNRLFWEPGLGSRSDNFSHVGMTHWGVFGARAAPKSMCTHQAHRLKKIDENRGFLWTTTKICA